jgi:signal transduction histidine kinase
LALAAVVTLLLGGLTLYLTREIDRRTMRDIELANERSKLQDAIECISEAFIIWDKDDRFVLCNEAYRQLYPQSAQFLQPGLSFEELLRHNLACGEYQNAVGREEQWFTEHTHLHQQASDVLELPLSNGRRVLITNRRMKSGGIAGLRMDVTNLVQTREDLKKSLIGLQVANTEMNESKERAEQAETLLTDAIECVSEAFVIYDKEDRLVLCNDSYRKLYPLTTRYMFPGIKFEELLRYGLAVGEYKDAIGREEQWLAERLQQHQRTSGAVENVRSDGRHIMTIERRMTSGGIAGLRIDITNLVQTREALEKALEKTEAASQAKTLFLANMSHELRTPLNAIIGFSQIIRDQIMGPIGKPVYADYAKDVCDAGEHLLEIINNVLDASRVEVNKFDLKEETVEIGELVQSAIQTVRVQAGKKSIALEQRLPEEPVGLRADTLRLRQVLINLLANAVKFTPEGGRVTLSFEASPAAAVFAVADTGIGMSPDEIAVATEPFRQIENALVKRHEGIGLGLSLAKHMTEMHSGTLEIISEKGVGTTVRVVLPPELILHAPKASAAA